MSGSQRCKRLAASYHKCLIALLAANGGGTFFKKQTNKNTGPDSAEYIFSVNKCNRHLKIAFYI